MARTVEQWKEIIRRHITDEEKAKLLIQNLMAYRPHTKWYEEDTENIRTFLNAIVEIEREDEANEPTG